MFDLICYLPQTINNTSGRAGGTDIAIEQLSLSRAASRVLIKFIFIKMSALPVSGLSRHALPRICCGWQFAGASCPC